MQESRLSEWKLTLTLLVFSTGVSAGIFVPVVYLVQQGELQLRDGIAIFILLTLLIHFVLFRAVVNQLMQINIALNYLYENKAVTEIPTGFAGLLQALVNATNRLIRERNDLKTMRGQLVEQISAAAAQEERNRLARDLHDSIKQQVFSISISAAAAHAHLESDPLAAREALLDVKQSAQEAMVEMRAMLQQLSPAPLEKSGLIQAIKDQCEAIAYRTGAFVETDFGDLPPDENLLPGTQETLFRITQEALSNTARHARAKHLRLSLTTKDQQQLILRISDDGQGFDPDQPSNGMGLANIRTRAADLGATVAIHSQAGNGVELIVTVPLVESIKKESEMQAQYETQLKPIISLYYRAAGGLAAFIVAVSMLIWRLLERPDGITEDGFLLFILGIFIFVTLTSLPFAALSWLRARPRTDELLLSAGQNSKTHLILKRNLRMAYLVIALACAWFLPVLAIGLGFTPWLRVGIGLIFTLLAIWNYAQMGELYRQELNLMKPSDRISELDKRLAEVRNAWWSVILLAGLVSITTLLRADIQLPPQEPGHWMDLSFLMIAGMLVLNQFINTSMYSQWRTEAQNEVTSA